MTLQRAQSETTSTEFVKWMKYLIQKKKDDLITHQKQDYYLAQIAAMIHNSVSKNPVSIESKLIELKIIKDKTKKEKPMTKEEAAKISKAFWCAATGWKR